MKPGDEILIRAKLISVRESDNEVTVGFDSTTTAVVPLGAVGEGSEREHSRGEGAAEAATSAISQGWQDHVAAKLSDGELSQGTFECDVCGLDTPHRHDEQTIEIERFIRPAFEKTIVPRNSFGRMHKKHGFPYLDGNTEALWQHFVSGWFSHATKERLAAEGRQRVVDAIVKGNVETLLAMQAAAPSLHKEGLPDEVAWLIERGGLCLGFCNRKFSWLTFTNESALRFSRRSDAIRFIEAMRGDMNLDDVLVTEHRWGL